MITIVILKFQFLIVQLKVMFNRNPRLLDGLFQFLIVQLKVPTAACT